MAYVNDETVIDEIKEDSGIYALKEHADQPETVNTPTGNRDIFNGDIFAVKKEHASQLGSLIGIALGAGVFLNQAYRLDKLLSRDEMGETWKATDIHGSRNVVVYLPPAALRKDETAIESIQKNATHVEALEHLRIVSFLDNSIDPEHGFFAVRKYVNGKTLDLFRTEYVKRHGRLAPTKIIKMLSDIAHALDYAHGVHIVHGDLCLKNIIVGLDDEVYLDNFACMPVEVATASAERKPYLAPEIVEGSAATARSDLYALAVIAYNLLSGRLPYTPETVKDTPLPIPDVPDAVDTIVRKALAQEPHDRYVSCDAFVKALGSCFQESKKIKSVVVTPSLKSSSKPPLKPSSKSMKKRNPARVTFWATLLGLLCMIGIVLAVVYLPILFSEAPPEQVDEQAVEPAREEGQLARRDRERPLPAQPTGVQPAGVLPTGVQPGGRRTPVVPIEVTPEEPEVSPTPQVEPEMSADNGDKPTQEESSVLLEESDDTTEGSVEETAVRGIESEESPAQSEELDSITEGTEDKMPVEPEAQPPITVAEIALPQRDNTGSSHNPERTLAISLVDAMREEGTATKITIGGIEYRFRWCTPPLTHGCWIQETTVTQESWRGVMGRNNIPPQPADGRLLPVRAVSRNECDRFAQRLNEEPDILSGEEFDTEYEYRFSLPTTAQWDHADGLEFLKTTNGVLEWCSDNEEGDHAVRNPATRRIERGYEDIGFRLVIMPHR
ncbi:MAG: protein kinase [Planctomycetaceae bacterium]|nr:protein kinase [Planctomycetaceae bacterium]